MSPKKEIKDRQGNKFTYDLSTGKITKNNGRQTYRVGSADNTEEFEKQVKDGKFD